MGFSAENAAQLSEYLNDTWPGNVVLSAGEDLNPAIGDGLEVAQA